MALIFDSKKLFERCLNPKGVSDEQIALGLCFKEEITNGKTPACYEEFVTDEVGHGLFADTDFEEGAFIGEYVGLVREQSVLNRMSDYAFRYPVLDELGRFLEVDAEYHGNHTRLINHSTKPNLNVKTAIVDGLFHVILITNRPIGRGEQFAYDYGKNYWLVRGAAQELL